MPPEKRPPLDSLTGLRFLAALHVVLLHVCSPSLTAPSYVLTNWVRSGFVSVELFFALSGFVLVYSYAGRQYSKKEFYVARWARIYPIYAVALVLSLPSFLKEIYAGAYSHTLVLACLLTVPGLLQAWFPPTALAWNSPAWSLSVEAFFYLLFPYLLAHVLKVSRRYWATALLAIWILAVAAPVIYLTANPDGVGWIGILVDTPAIGQADTHGWLGVVHFNPILHLPEFLGGALTGAFFLERRRSAASGTSSSTMTICAGAAGIVIIGVLGFADRIPVLLLGNGLLLPLFCTLIYTLAWQRDYFSRILSRPLMLILGEASYGIYILQIPLRTVFRALWQMVTGNKLPGEMTFWPAVLLFTVFLSGICVAAHYLIERPLRTRIKNAYLGPLIAGNQARAPIVGDII